MADDHWICKECHALISNVAAHSAWHREVEQALADAQRAPAQQSGRRIDDSTV